MAASTAVLAVTGAWYGAGLKEKQEIKQVQISPGLTCVGLAQLVNENTRSKGCWLIIAAVYRKPKPVTRPRQLTGLPSLSKRGRDSCPKELV